MMRSSGQVARRTRRTSLTERSFSPGDGPRPNGEEQVGPLAGRHRVTDAQEVSVVGGEDPV